MPIPANAQKNFHWRIEYGGVDIGEAQKVTLPEVSVTQISHGGYGGPIKTPGLRTVGDLVLEKLRAIIPGDRLFIDELDAARNESGGGVTPSILKRNIVVKELGANGLTIARHLCIGCWVTKRTMSEFSRTDGANLMETITFSVDDYDQL